MSDEWTVRAVAQRVVELGLVDQSVVAEKLDADILDETLDYFGDDELGVLGLLEELGLRYTTEYKMFKGLSVAGEDRLSRYRYELELIASCTQGLLTITEIQLVDGADGGQQLSFRCNGHPQSWPVYPGPDEDLEAQLTFAEYVDTLVPDDSPARWCTPDPSDPDVGSEFVFGDPAALNQLGGAFDLTFEP
ncbi:hypothetical protein ACFYO1_00530 [Nocardia sp. NPDC006044]|uniref:hypothetical protein n=1 Tax=Nocardia sp. NPDC006044 TaxID=3364306 RepID=UPI00369540F8